MSGSTKGTSRATSGRVPQVLAPLDVDARPAIRQQGSDLMTALVDQLTADVVLRHATGCRVLDLGRGAPSVTEWVGPRAEQLTVVDAVDLGRGATIRMPLPGHSYDCVYSLRTLPHLGHDAATSEAALESALHEIGRVLAPGGVAVLEFANARSPFGLYHGLRQLDRQLGGGPLVVDSPRGLTRFDVIGRVIPRLPPTLTPVDLHGVRLLAASPHALALPVVGRLITRVEWWSRDQPLLRRFCAHLLLIVRRLTPPRENP